MFKVSTLQTLRKNCMPLCSRYLCERRICASVFQQQYILHYKHAQPSSRFQSSLSHEVKLNVLQRTKKRLADYLSLKTKGKMAGCLAYENCADTIDYDEFFKMFGLPDTFQSWFSSMELHVWMCILVAIPLENGRDFRNGLVDSMWHDVELRLSRLAEMKTSSKKKYLKELVAQFQAALISYDEGMLDGKGDRVLAAAAWRTLFCLKSVDPQMLENIVIYIRKQITHLDSLNREQIILRGTVTFLPLKEIFSNSELK